MNLIVNPIERLVKIEYKNSFLLEHVRIIVEKNFHIFKSNRKFSKILFKIKEVFYEEIRKSNAFYFTYY